MGMQDGFSVDMRFFRLPDELAPYFTALFLFEIECEEGRHVADCAHPDWASMRFAIRGRLPAAKFGEGDLEPCSRFGVTGPISQSYRFCLQASLVWVVGLQPAGFAKYIEISASNSANRVVPGLGSEFEVFAPIGEIACQGGNDWGVTAEKITQFLLSLEGTQSVHEAKVLACQSALHDRDIVTVEDLAGQVGVSRRSLERLCVRFFGFPPKKLLRRQRFLRSLAQFTHAPSESWSKALDDQYYDQAHFVRDFKSFMGMTPSQYAEQDHPILDRVMAIRMADHGAAPAQAGPALDSSGPSPSLILTQPNIGPARIRRRLD